MYFVLYLFSISVTGVMRSFSDFSAPAAFRNSSDAASKATRVALLAASKHFMSRYATHETSGAKCDE
jgi:hypothetical protein